MSDSDRELRDRLEAAQSELKRANQRLDELEGIAGDRDVLRAELDVAKAELKQANDRLAELEEQSTEELQAVLEEVTQDRDLLRQRLEQADKTREQWDHKVSAREAELAASRAEEWRLREELAAAEKPAVAPVQRRPPRWLIAVPLASAAIGALVLMRSC